MNWIVYILRCKDKTLYCGVTNDLEARLEKHRKGTGAKYTRGRGPFKLLRSERHPSKSAALKREIAIKKLTRAEKLKLCNNKT
jgi:putative endonuclease